MGFRERPRAGARRAGLKVGGMRTMLLAIAVALCACLAVPVTASAAGTGSIEGAVHEAASAKKPIKGLCVAAYLPGRSFYAGTWKVTAASGEYKIEGLAEGSYDVRFFKCEEEEAEQLTGANSTLNYAPRYYNEQSVAANAEVVKVEAGKVATNIDAEMKTGGEIDGEALNAQGDGLEHVCVVAFPRTEDGPQEAVYTESGAGGVYQLTGLQSGSYLVAYSDCGVNIVGAYYDAAASPSHRASVSESATEITVKAEVEPAVAADLLPVRLEAGAVIEGSITDSEGMDVTAPMCVEAFSPRGAGFGGFTFTESGHYRIEGLSSGAYDLVIGECAEVESEPVWASQYYNGVSKLAEAMTVSVTAGVEPPIPTTANFKLVRASATKPMSIAAPAISGVAGVGQALTCTPGSWSGTPTPTYSYQWLREGSAIAGATSATYMVQKADEGHGLACAVTATNEAGSGSERSATTQIPLVPPPPQPGTAAAGRSAIVKSGTAQLNLACSGQGACSGMLKLVAKVTVKVGKHHKRKLMSVAVGQATFSITAGGYETISVHLTAKGKSLLAKAGKHGLSVLMSGSGVQARTVQLTAAAKKGKR